MESARDQFHSEIQALERSARRELEERADPAPWAPRRRRLSRILWVGGALILAEVVLLGAQLVMQNQSRSELVAQPTHRLAASPTCKGEQYRTFEALRAYRRDHGEWPLSLASLVGPYLERLPRSPGTLHPLEYVRRDDGFTLSCPKS